MLKGLLFFLKKSVLPMALEERKRLSFIYLWPALAIKERWLLNSCFLDSLSKLSNRYVATIAGCFMNFDYIRLE